MRFKFDKKKNATLKRIQNAVLVFEEAREILRHPYYQDQRQDRLEQYRAIGWVGGLLYSMIFEIRKDKAGEYYDLVTLWKSTREERSLYEENL